MFVLDENERSRTVGRGQDRAVGAGARAGPLAPIVSPTVRVSVERAIRVKLCKTCGERVRSRPRHTKLRRACAAHDRLRVDKTIPDTEYPDFIQIDILNT
ncbi:MAG: hypothetical protein E6J90_21625 [Deltaproteobacteria bacterium]|nr:MAG: hypothetical protein E6J91_11745 [Deltaproteobacteria bacterium]TMQ17848.1 MAG: hypothetical protein E6J90_21625 [Deltaproteobacteria bacterium]